MRKSIDHVNQMADPGLDANADAVFEAIHAVMHLYRAGQYRDLRAGTLELSHVEGKVLGFFARHTGATQVDLVRHSGRDKGQLARLIRSLRERGLLDASPDPADRRQVHLHPTEAGLRVVQALSQRGRRQNDQAVSRLDAGERRQLVALLAKVRAGLEGED